MSAAAPPATITRPCVTCDAPLHAEYCAACGERRPDARDLRLRSFLAHALSDILDVDARGYRTFRALLFRPGLLTDEFVTGRRRPWLSPFQVFLVCNLVFFIGASFMPLEALTTSLQTQIARQPYSDFARTVLADRNVSAYPGGFAAFEAAYDFATDQYAKSLVLLLAVGMAGVTALVLAARRDPFVKHVVFGLHVVALLLLLMIAVGAAASLLDVILPGAAQTWIRDEFVFVAAVFAVFVPYLYSAFRRAYELRPGRAATAAVLLFLSLPLLLTGYRFLLFMLVVYTI